ncbi:MAG: class I SAM-dependent methyltransferase [Saprospiraceae bacterium]|nr:class I SAM-dependent methyltransferase [Saprospiraceae bacterium]
MSNLFLDISLSSRYLDYFIPRKALLRAVSTVLPRFSGEVLDIGCGSMPYRDLILHVDGVDSYTGLDIEHALEYDGTPPDLTWDGLTMPVADHSYDWGLSTEVLEHVPDPAHFLQETYRVLKPGGFYFFTVPFLWPLHEVPHDVCRYTPFTLQRIMVDTGFKVVQLEALGGWNAALGQLLALWIRRSIRNVMLKKIISILAMPLIWLLDRTDRAPVHFSEGQMITGLWGVLQKPVVG